MRIGGTWNWLRIMFSDKILYGSTATFTTIIVSVEFLQ